MNKLRNLNAFIMAYHETMTSDLEGSGMWEWDIVIMYRVGLVRKKTRELLAKIKK